MPTSSQAGPFVLVGQQAGVTVIPANALLARLHYYDGKFLRAEDLTAEQEYFRHLIAASNQAGGPGIVHGFEVALAGESLRFAPGLAIDPAGRVLLHAQECTIEAQKLIEKSQQAMAKTAGAPEGNGKFAPCEVKAAAGPDAVLPGADVYLISVAYAEALCGEEDVYGKLCEEACATSTDRPYAIDGVVFRADPVTGLAFPLPSKAFPPTQVQFRSRLASAYFAAERARNPDLISKAGLLSMVWCNGAAAAGGSAVPLALLVRAGSTNRFIDLWSARRERMDGTPRRSWQWRMAMRPWDVFLAQVLQFQCQLRDLFQDVPTSGGEDPCRETRSLLGVATKVLADLHTYYGTVATTLSAPGVAKFPGGFEPIGGLVKKLNDANAASAALSMDHVLLRGGIVELPSAGYLPVSAGGSETVNVQVRRLLGEGLDLRFCVVRPDFVAHALEEAQHMERISLTAGLDYPADKPHVDVLVPDGKIVPVDVVPIGTAYEMTLELFTEVLVVLVGLLRREPTASPGGLVTTAAPGGAVPAGGVTPAGGATIHATLGTIGKPTGPQLSFRGAARGELTASGGSAFYFAGAFLPPPPPPPQFTLIELLQYSAVWLSMNAARDPFALNRNESTAATGECIVLIQKTCVRLGLSGNLQVTDSVSSGTKLRVTARLSGTLTIETRSPAGAVTQRAVSISESVTLVRDSSAPANPAIEVTVLQPALLGKLPTVIAFRSTRNWTSATVAKVDGVLLTRPVPQPAAPSFTLIPETVPLYTGVQTVNPDVLRPEHPAHVLALTGLRSIAGALNDLQFDDVAARQLFPPPQAATGNIVIRAQAEWVLFHRRREKQCAFLDSGAGPLQPRRYRVYQVSLKEKKSRDDLSQALVANSPSDIAAFHPEQIDVVAYSAGIQSLDTPVASIREDWQGRVKDPVQIVYGAVATQGSAVDEGTDLASARLASLTNALGPISPSADDIKLDVLPAVPDASVITASPNDGVMVLATVPLPTNCHTVFRLVANNQTATALSQRISGTAAASINKLLTDARAEPLAKATFLEGTDQFFAAATDDLAAAWFQKGDGKVSQVIVISRRPANPAAPTADETARITSYRTQAARIAGEAGTPVSMDKITHRPPEDAAALPGCPGITVLVVAAD